MRKGSGGWPVFHRIEAAQLRRFKKETDIGLRAFIFSKTGIIEEKELPAPRLDNRRAADRRAAILKPRFLSPCSSDVHTVFAGPGPRRENLILGHEGLAEIVETGADVRDFKPGELVAVSAVMPEPGDLTGHQGVPFSGTKLGRSLDGMWAESFRVPDADCNLAHIPEGLSMEAALMAVDMMATGYTAAEEAEISAGQTIVVIGSGAVGLMAAAAARSLTGADGRVIMIGSDKDPYNAEMAKMFGVDIYISYRSGRVVYANEKQDLSAFPERDSRANATGSAAVDAVFRVTGGYGADRVLICGGGPEALAQASDLVRYGTGIVVNIAYLEGSGMAGLPIFSLGRGMSGKIFKFELSRGGRAWTEKMLAEALKCGGLQGRLVTHRLKGFDAVPEGLELMRKRPAGLIKVMVEV